MCDFCERHYYLNPAGLEQFGIKTVTPEKPGPNMAINYLRMTSSNKYVEAVLQESGEGAAWFHKTVKDTFKINYCPICGKRIG